jgi:hypothetical protein
MTMARPGSVPTLALISAATAAVGVVSDVITNLYVADRSGTIQHARQAGLDEADRREHPR